MRTKKLGLVNLPVLSAGIMPASSSILFTMFCPGLPVWEDGPLVVQGKLEDRVQGATPVANSIWGYCRKSCHPVTGSQSEGFCANTLVAQMHRNLRNGLNDDV